MEAAVDRGFATQGVRHPRHRGGILLTSVALVLATQGVSSAQSVTAHWVPLIPAPGVFDLTGVRRDGSVTVAANGRLFLLRPGGALEAFANGPGGYATAPGPETYITLVRQRRVPGAGCAFRRDDVYALEVTTPGVVAVDTGGQARPFATLPAGVFPDGIAFDQVGRFQNPLLVTALIASTTTLFAIDCAGQVSTVVSGAPRVEGGIAVAPRSFGRYAGQLIAPDELSGAIVAFDARGEVSTIAMSGLPVGGDIGVESLGFVPPRFRPRDAALLADRGTPGSPHPGTDSILSIGGDALLAAGVRSGDLLVATEASADTIAVRCRRTCTVRPIADGPAVAHPEGHIVFTRGH